MWLSTLACAGLGSVLLRSSWYDSGDGVLASFALLLTNPWTSAQRLREAGLTHPVPYDPTVLFGPARLPMDEVDTPSVEFVDDAAFFAFPPTAREVLPTRSQAF